MALLSDFETVVRTQIRDNGTTQVFANAEIDQFIADAVAQYSRYRPRKRPITLNIVSGQTQYTLPVDWITAERNSFERAVNPQPSRTIYGLYGFEFDGLMTLPGNLGLRYYAFDWYDSDQMLVISPSPGTSYTITFDYYAAHQVSTTLACTIAAQDQYVAMLWAASQALEALCTDKSDKLLKYKLGSGISMDNTETVKALETRAHGFRTTWENEIMLRPSGRSGGDLSGTRGLADYGGIW